MPLDYCWCCSLRVASSVISIYMTVAYMIALSIELWWVWSTGGQLPHLGYILIMGYLVAFILSVVLVKGVSEKQLPHLLLWLIGTLAVLLPEAGLVLFMTIQFWKIYTIYGLTEITFWICRLIVNIAGLISVYSLYRNWKEEKHVLNSLRDLNMASRAVLEAGRRASVTSIKAPHSYSNPGFVPLTDSTLALPRTTLRRSNSMTLMPPPRPASPSPSLNEFNADQFSRELRESRSVTDLRATPPPSQATVPRTSVPPRHTASLDRRLLYRSRSFGFFPIEDRLRNGYFTAFSPSGFIIDPELGRVSYLHDIWTKPLPGGSKSSIESDDMHKYKDVAL